MLKLTFSSKLDWGSYIISIAKTASKKFGAFNLLSPVVALYLYESTIQTCVEYSCHVWVGAPSCYLELLDKNRYAELLVLHLLPLLNPWLTVKM